MREDSSMTEDLMAKLAASIQRARAEQRARDNEPCPRCGGDRLRTDFTDSGRCHAPRQAPIPEVCRVCGQAEPNPECRICRTLSDPDWKVDF